MRHLTIPTLLATLATPMAAAAQDGTVVFRGATVMPVDREPITDGIVIVSNGRIRAVGGADLPLPEGARIVDCSGKVITPGLIDAATRLGIDDRDANEQQHEVTPHLTVLDALDPADDGFRRARRRGVTTVQVGPGNRNVIGGLAAVVKTAGDTVADMLVRDTESLRLALGSQPSAGNRAIRGGTPAGLTYRRPTTRMGVVWTVRKAFYDARNYAERRTADPEAAAAEAADPGLEVLVSAMNQELPVRTTARAEQDIRTALRLAGEFGYRPVLEEAVEAWRIPELIAASGAHVVLAPPSVDTERGPIRSDRAEVRLHTAAELARHGVRFALHTGAELGAQALIDEAIFAVRNGLSPDRALAAITLVPAEILRIDDRLGSLTAGKDADLVVWSGDPLDPRSRTESVWISGLEVHGD